MAVQGITVARDQRLKRITLSREYTLNDQLISILIGYWCGLLRRFHDNRVTLIPRFGQGRGCAPAGGPWFHGSRHGGGDEKG
jgi:hypothetical protein